MYNPSTDEFNSIADKFKNKGIASNQQRMAGDYLSEFAKSDGVKSILGGSRDYRDGVRNEKSNAPSSVMKTMGATSNNTPAAPAVSKPAPQATPTPAASQPKPSANTDKGGRPTSSPNAGMTEGQKVASLVRPEYAKQAAAFTDKVQAMNVSDETKGLIMSQMGGDLYLPDPKKWEAKMKERHGNDPALLSNILTYMGGGAGKVGHNR